MDLERLRTFAVSWATAQIVPAMADAPGPGTWVDAGLFLGSVCCFVWSVSLIARAWRKNPYLARRTARPS